MAQNYFAPIQNAMAQSGQNALTINQVNRQRAQDERQNMMDQRQMAAQDEESRRKQLEQMSVYAQRILSAPKELQPHLYDLANQQFGGGRGPAWGQGGIEITQQYAALAEQPKVDYQLKQNAQGEFVRIPTSPGAEVSPTGIMGETGKGKTTVHIDTGAKSMTKLGEEMSKALVTRRDDAIGATKGLDSLREAKKLLSSGIITGTGAEFLTSLGNLLSSRLGYDVYEDPVANTQAFAATMGNQVGQIIKQFGSGTGLSDADREYAEKIVGGKISVNEKAIKKLMEINEKAYKNVIRSYQKDAERAMSRPGAEGLPYDLRLDYDLNGNRPQEQNPATGTTANNQPTVQEGTTATNPQTGQKIIFRNGKWENM